MNVFQGVFFLILGVGVALVALQGIARGWLPNGPKGFRPGDGVSRNARPWAFWCLFALYFAGGLLLTVYAIRLLLGQVSPLPLR